MKSFDAYFDRAQVPEWREYYINYSSLKKKIRLYGKRRRQLDRGEIEWSSVLVVRTNELQEDEGGQNSTSADSFGYVLQQDDNGFDGLIGCDIFGSSTAKQAQLSQLEHDEFKTLLQHELDKASKFLHKHWIDIVIKEQEGEMILDLYAFAVVNICVMRQLLLKYNAYISYYDDSRAAMALSEWEVLKREQFEFQFFALASSPSPKPRSSTATTSKSGDAEQFTSNILLNACGSMNNYYKEEEEEDDAAMYPPLMDALEPIQDHIMRMSSYWATATTTKEAPQKNSAFRKRCDELDIILDKTSWKGETRASSKSARFLQSIRYCYSIGSTATGISMEPKFLRNVRGFKKEMKALALWRESSLEEEGGIGKEEGPPAAEGEMAPENVWPLFLNLVSCFLCMMNSYIIEPSSAYYANYLGGNDALSGVMLGMAPFFALTSSVMYSMWTNTSYKQPMLFAGFLKVVGNLMYGSAYTYQSMTIVLIGRAITGFGAPRIINRRYVADATPFKLRTMSSAAFALTTALGAASGPGFAILLDMVPEFQFPLPFLGQQSFNGMTGPGFTMALMWLIYTIAIAVSFNEPKRTGLDELKRREEKAAEESNKAQALNTSYEKNDSFADDDSVSSVGSDSEASFAQSKSERNKATSTSLHSPMHCIRNMTRATALCMALIFLKRITLESIVGSTSVITKNRYGWTIRNVGVLNLANGLLVIPVSIFAGWLSQFREDRYLAMCFMGITGIGMLFLIDPTDFIDTSSSDTYNSDMVLSVGPIQYIAGSLVAFSGVEACESFVASLMSKVVPSALAVGTFNSGLLTTLVGTGGRAAGDLFITTMGLISIRNLLNLLILPGLALVVLSMFLLWRNYKIVSL